MARMPPCELLESCLSLQVMAHHCRETAQMVGRPAHLPAFASYAGDIEADISAARKCIARPNAQKKGQPGKQRKREEQTPARGQAGRRTAPKKRKTVVDASLAASSGVPDDIQPGVWTLRRMWARGAAKARCKGIGCNAKFFKGAPSA
jgi:hypothetical protein